MPSDGAEDDSGAPRPILSISYARFLLAAPFLFLAVLFGEMSDMLAYLGERIAGGLDDV